MRNSRIFSSMAPEWFHIAAAISKKDPLTAVRPRSGPTVPPAPRTAWHWTHPFATKSDWPRVGSPTAAPAPRGRRPRARPARTAFPVNPRRSATKGPRRPSAMGNLRRGRQVAFHALGDLANPVLPPFADFPDRDDREKLREDGVEEEKHRHEGRQKRPFDPRGDI